MHRFNRIDETLESILEKLDNLREQQHKQDVRLSLTELKSGVFGSIGGALSVLVVLFYEWVNAHFKN